MPQLAIIIVNYNAGDWLQRSVQSALNFSDADVYVVDNASTDNSVSSTQSLLVQESKLHWQLNQQNLGFAAANNQILSQLECDFVVLMNPDCEINAQTIATILEQFDLHPKLGLASCKIIDESGDIQTTCRRRFPTPMSALARMLFLNKLFPENPKFANFDYGDKPDSGEALQQVEAISGAFMVARVDAIKEVGFLDEGYFMHCEDLDWCWRFRHQGWQVGFVSAAMLVHAKGVSSKSRPISVLWTLHKGMNRFFDKFYYDKYNWVLRYLVKVGIYISFAARAGIAFVRGLIK